MRVQDKKKSSLELIVDQEMAKCFGAQSRENANPALLHKSGIPLQKHSKYGGNRLSLKKEILIFIRLGSLFAFHKAWTANVKSVEFPCCCKGSRISALILLQI